MKQNEVLAAASMQVAIKEVGVKEATGHNDGARVGEFQKFAGLVKGLPWCAAYAMWCIYQAAKAMGIKPVLPVSGSSTQLYAFAKKHGLLLTAPEVNCLAVVKGSGGTKGKTHHHTFRVRSIDPKLGIVHGIDGNKGNMVKYTVHAIASCDFIAVA